MSDKRARRSGKETRGLQTKSGKDGTSTRLGDRWNSNEKALEKTQEKGERGARSILPGKSQGKC